MATPDTIQLNEEYTRSVELQYQQRTSHLYNCVRHTEQEAVRKFENYIGTIKFEPIVTANGDTVLQNVDHTRRAVDVHREAAGVPLDDEYDLHSVTDLGGPYMESLYAGAGRLVDETIYAALGAIVYTGKTGGTAVNNYDSGECRLMEGDGTWVTAGSDFSGSTETQLTVSKLKAIKAVFRNAEVPEDGRFGLVNEYNINNLISDTTWDGEEVKTVRDIQSGKMGRLLGFDWVVLADSMFTTNTTDTGCIECYFWQRDAMIFSRGKGRKMPTVRVGPRPDKNYMMQFWSDMYVGATRLRGPGVCEVLLDKE